MSTTAEEISTTITGSQALIQALLREEVDVIFGYPGGAIMPVYDAIYDVRQQLRHVLVRHEQGAAHAAQGYSRATGKVGVCIVTSGPAATNLITGLTDALMDSTPLICITGQVVSGLLGTDAFQEADVTGLTLAATKWNYQIADPQEIPAVMAKAFQIARSGRPGPVLIDITKDAQQGICRTDIPSAVSQWPEVAAARHFAGRSSGHSDLSGLPRAVALINEARRPYLLVGHGVLLARAEKELRQLAEKAGIPVACTLLGLSAFPTSHSLYVGMLGMHGHYATNLLTNEADVIIAVGMRFDDRVTGRLDGYAKQARIIHIEIDPAEVDKNVPADVALIADAKKALQALLPDIEPRQHLEWLERFHQLYDEEYRQVVRDELHPKGGPLKMGEVVDRISTRAADNAIVVSDVGQHQMLVARHYRFRAPDSHITSGGLGTMGFALPAALGAKLGASDRPVIAIIGDGGFQMTLQELGTLMQEGLPLKIVVLNNGYLGMVRQWQELFFKSRYSFVHMESPDFVTVVKGYGIPGQRVSERQELERAIDALLETDGPAFLEVIVDRTDNVFPMIPAGAAVNEVRLN